MKKLYIIKGTMGIGKTTVSKLLKNSLDRSVFLDGDWCWDMFPFIVNEETKKMVIDNIIYLLNNFLKCSEYKNIIFCWVLNLKEVEKEILSRLNLEKVEVFSISLVCNEIELEKRLKKDIELGLRKEEIILKSKERLKDYKNHEGIKIEVSNLTPVEIVNIIKNIK
ncbi:MAG: AAA family ATPase [Fusobacterium perfoetens]|uniref:AAA family ATPase n=1 Tax=Fusobacterium perfoetens TaxID=852 RepID=UPI0023F10AC7|nr:AAA family ATPase [Fusobacterium perfoetens]MCI6152013.1 AAA family ATPase [Fusobacterium perfoetens]MDY3238096.1 AAA family ATPase [Fusobacterium perfoetens]